MATSIHLFIQGPEFLDGQFHSWFPRHPEVLSKHGIVSRYVHQCALHDFIYNTQYYNVHMYVYTTYMYPMITLCNSWIQDCNSSVWVTKDQRESGWIAVLVEVSKTLSEWLRKHPFLSSNLATFRAHARLETRTGGCVCLSWLVWNFSVVLLHFYPHWDDFDKWLSDSQETKSTSKCSLYFLVCGFKSYANLIFNIHLETLA